MSRDQRVAVAVAVLFALGILLACLTITNALTPDGTGVPVRVPTSQPGPVVPQEGTTP